MLNEEELRFVHSLQEFPRASWATLGNVLGADPRAVTRTYMRLVESGQLRLSGMPGPRLLENIQIMQVRLRAAPGRAEEVANQLAHWSQATSVRVLDGSFDVHALVVGVEHRAALRQVHETIARLRDVDRLEVNTVLRTVDVGRAGRLVSLSRDQVRTLRAAQPSSSDRSPTRLMATDIELIRTLNSDGRMEVKELARRLDRDPSTLSRRIARLTSDGYLDFLALTVDTASAFPVIAFLWCTASPADLQTLATQLPTKPWLGSFTVISGHTNICIVAYLQVASALSRVAEYVSALSSSLRIVETQIAGHAVKMYNWFLDQEGRFTDRLSDPHDGLAHHLIESSDRRAL